MDFSTMENMIWALRTVLDGVLTLELNYEFWEDAHQLSIQDVQKIHRVFDDFFTMLHDQYKMYPNLIEEIEMTHNVLVRVLLAGLNVPFPSHVGLHIQSVLANMSEVYHDLFEDRLNDTFTKCGLSMHNSQLEEEFDKMIL